MADNIVTDPVIVADPTAPVISPEQLQAKTEVDKMMQISLNGGIAPKVDVIAPVVTDTKNEPTVVVDHFGVLKEKLGYSTAEDALAEIENLRKLKDAPPAYKFENEESEKLFNAWKGGKKSEVYNYLSQEMQIDNLLSKEITKDTAADYVKLGMQLKYKDLTPEEINYKFNKQFGTSPKPTQSEGEDADDFRTRLSSWEATAADRHMELMIEAKLAKPEVAASKKNLVFPDTNPSDDGYAQYKKMLEDQPKLQEQQKAAHDELVASYRSFTRKALETSMDFIDEANKINFKFQYEPTAEELNRSVEMVTDIQKFYNQFIGQDGKPNRRDFLEAINFAINRKSIIMEAMKQTKNATITAGLPDNSSGGLVRHIAQPLATSELDKQMEANGIRRQ